MIQVNVCFTWINYDLIFHSLEDAKEYLCSDPKPEKQKFNPI